MTDRPNLKSALMSLGLVCMALLLDFLFYSELSGAVYMLPLGATFFASLFAGELFGLLAIAVSLVALTLLQQYPPKIIPHHGSFTTRYVVFLILALLLWRVSSWLRKSLLKYQLSLENLVNQRTQELQAMIQKQDKTYHQLQKSERFLNLILENIPNAIFVKEVTQLRYIVFNQAAEELTGLKREEVIGKTDFEVLPRDQAEILVSQDRALLQTLRDIDISLQEVHTGSRGCRTVRTRKVLVRNERGEPDFILGISEDITDLIKTELERDLSQKHAIQLEEENRLRDTFIAAISHDLRTPLTAARAAAELIVKVPMAPENYIALASRILSAVDRSEKMIRDFLDANRIEAGRRLPLTLEEVHLGILIREIIDEYKNVYGDYFELLESGSGLVGNWSHEYLRRAVENLMSNAVKYGLPNKLIRITLQGHEDLVEISVHNEGNPIPDSEKATLFQRFSRTNAAQKSGKSGWGIGLLLVRGVAEAHGGRVRLESSPEHGTTFTIELPRNAQFQYQRLDFNPNEASKSNQTIQRIQTDKAKDR